MAVAVVAAATAIILPVLWSPVTGVAPPSRPGEPAAGATAPRDAAVAPGAARGVPSSAEVNDRPGDLGRAGLVPSESLPAPGDALAEPVPPLRPAAPPRGDRIGWIGAGGSGADEEVSRERIQEVLRGASTAVSAGSEDWEELRSAFVAARDPETKSELLSVAVEVAGRLGRDPSELLALALQPGQPEDVRHAALYYLQQSDPDLLEEIAASSDESLNTHARGYLRQMLVNRGILRAPQELPPEMEVTMPGAAGGAR